MSTHAYLKSIICSVLTFLALLFLPLLNVSGQEDPPVPLTVTTVVSSISFGTMYDPGNDGGSIRIDPELGGKTLAGIIAIGSSYSRGEYEVQGNAGTLVVLTYSTDIVLNRDGGGGSLTLHLELYPSGWMVLEASPAINKLYVGGTLDISAGILPGTYNSGEFFITLNQQ